MEWLQQQDVDVGGYLKINAESIYGNNVFKISLSNLLLSYRESRIQSDKSATLKEVTFRVGGTLRYKHEICYVVIVCMDGDNIKDQLGLKYPSIWGQDIFDHKGMISRDGSIEDYSKIPEFKAQYIVKCINDAGKYNSFSWEAMAFAFYFPSGDTEFRFTVDKVTEANILHPFCTSTRRGPQGNMLCPNARA